MSIRSLLEYVGVKVGPVIKVGDRAVDHQYLSTGCLHGEHDYCKATESRAGAKRPAQCKWCAAPCTCSCHADQPVDVSDQERPAPVDWQAVVKRRERELKAVGKRIQIAYRERARLVALLAALYPSALVTDGDPAEPDWPVLYVTLPTGQASWHIAPDDVELFSHVDVYDNATPGAPQWDGHTTEEKYERIAAHVRAVRHGEG
jgi:hypothetical protein